MIVVFTNAARADLEEIHAYIARESVERAQDVVAIIQLATERLAIFPESGRPGRRRDTRELVLHRLPYILPYRVIGDRVMILRVQHTSSQWPDR